MSEAIMKEPFVDFIKKELEPKTVLRACGLPAKNKTGSMKAEQFLDRLNEPELHEPIPLLKRCNRV